MNMSEAMQIAKEEAINYTTAAALRHAADCVDKLVDKGEPMQDRQTFRRAFNAADEYIIQSELSGKDFDAAIDEMGEVVGKALEHEISGKDAATFYRNQANEIEG